MTISASDALLRLQEGNRLFREPPSAGVAGVDPSRTFVDLSEGQAPFAAVLGCSDSRVPVEAIFSQEIGELFVVRVAGNVVGQPQLGSLEFAVSVLGVRLVMVLGHTGCGAIDQALASNPPGQPSAKSGTDNLQSILWPISRAISRQGNSLGRSDPISATEAVRLNVEAACEELTLQSEVLASRTRSGQVLIMGSIYDLKTGRVEFLGNGGQVPDVP